MEEEKNTIQNKIDLGNKNVKIGIIAILVLVIIILIVSCSSKKTSEIEKVENLSVENTDEIETAINATENIEEQEEIAESKIKNNQKSENTDSQENVTKENTDDSAMKEEIVTETLEPKTEASETTIENAETEMKENDTANEVSAEKSEAEEKNVSDVKQETKSSVTQINTVPEKNDDIFSQMTDKEKNSYAMLYYLSVTAEQISIARNSRLILDDIYHTLENNLDPEAIDEITQDRLRNLREDINSFRQINVKRDRLQYIYNQQKANSMRSLVAEPLAFLSIAASKDWKQLASSVIYTIVDSYNNYKETNTSTDDEFLLSGWELEDEENDTILRNRDRSFDYMVDITQEYQLEGGLTLSKDSIEDFAKICEIEQLEEKIIRLEAEEKTYKLFGKYWLELAECYFEDGQDKKGLDCIETYKKLSVDIYRKDNDYVQILPQAIASAKQIYRGNYRIAKVKEFADAIIENTNTKDWSLRYFAVLAYLDIYNATNDSECLDKAFAETKNTIAVLLPAQRELNETYLNALKIIKIKEPDYRFMSDKEKKEAEKEYKKELKRLKEYNNALEKARTVELPPLYEPLILNCDLLFSIAEMKPCTSGEKKSIEKLLETKTNGVFLSEAINNRYSFASNKEEYSVEFSGEKMLIPANLLTENAKIRVSVTTNKKTQVFDDFNVTKVERNGDTIESFVACLSSKSIKKYQWGKDSKITVSIIFDEEWLSLKFRFKVSEFKDRAVGIDKVVFVEQ